MFRCWNEALDVTKGFKTFARLLLRQQLTFGSTGAQFDQLLATEIVSHRHLPLYNCAADYIDNVPTNLLFVWRQKEIYSGIEWRTRTSRRRKGSI